MAKLVGTACTCEGRARDTQVTRKSCKVQQIFCATAGIYTVRAPVICKNKLIIAGTTLQGVIADSPFENIIISFTTECDVTGKRRCIKGVSRITASEFGLFDAAESYRITANAQTGVSKGHIRVAGNLYCICSVPAGQGIITAPAGEFVIA